MKRKSLIKMLIVVGIILGFTPNVDVSAAQLNDNVSKEVSTKVVKNGWIIRDGKRYYMNAKGERVRYLQ
ncbi:MAG: hypothetical protein RRY19_06100, partial [Clostridium sp.]